MVVLALPQELTAIVESGGVQALERVPGVGRSLATTIADYLSSLRAARIITT
jgi:DNA polymerase (family 10)